MPRKNTSIMPSRLHLSASQPEGTAPSRSEEHTSELQSLMRNSYAVFCLKKKKNKTNKNDREIHITLEKNKRGKTLMMNLCRITPMFHEIPSIQLINKPRRQL